MNLSHKIIQSSGQFYRNQPLPNSKIPKLSYKKILPHKPPLVLLFSSPLWNKQTSSHPLSLSYVASSAFFLAISLKKKLHICLLCVCEQNWAEVFGDFSIWLLWNLRSKIFEVFSCWFDALLIVYYGYSSKFLSRFEISMRFISILDVVWLVINEFSMLFGKWNYYG